MVIAQSNQSVRGSSVAQRSGPGTRCCRADSRAGRTVFAQIPAMTIADSYAIQHEWVRLQLALGRKAIGHKIGLTSRAMQIALANHRARLRHLTRFDVDS
jgi:2-keto-4-pentenoate hydratase